MHAALECTNYWSPLPNAPLSCRNESNGKAVLAHQCVGNLTSKIQGDDSEYIVVRNMIIRGWDEGE